MVALFPNMQELSTTQTATTQLPMDQYMLEICSVQDLNQLSSIAFTLQCHPVGTMMTVVYDVQVLVAPFLPFSSTLLIHN